MPDTTPKPSDLDPAGQPSSQEVRPRSSDGPSTEHTRLPDDHPLVTAYATVKAESADQRARIETMQTEHQDALAQVTQRAESAEAESAQADARVAQQLRGHLAQIHEISEDDTVLYLTSDDPATLLRQAQGIAARKKNGVVPTQGTAQQPQVSAYELGRERGQARYHNQN